MKAANNGHIKTLQALVALGADIHAKDWVSTIHIYAMILIQYSMLLSASLNYAMVP